VATPPTPEVTSAIAHLMGYFTPEHVGDTFAKVLLPVTATAGAIGYSLAMWFGGKAKANSDLEKAKDAVVDQKEDEYDKLVELLREQNELLKDQNEGLATGVDQLTIKVTNLEAKVGRLVDWLTTLACLNAPTCDKRNCPNRILLTKIIEGDHVDLMDLTSGDPT
jgi:uncharacterized protein YlxW (UPF0749 family)